MPKNVKYGTGAGILLLLLMLFSCHRYKVDLGNGFDLTRMNRYRYSVTESRRGDYPVISGNVEQYAFSAPFVVGYASTNHINAGTNKVDGWFIVNTDNHVVKQAMSGEDWTNELDHVHWANPPLQNVP